MSKHIVKQGQSFLDKTIQLTGGLDSVLDLAIENGVSLTDNLPIGTEIKASTVTNKRIAAFFNEKNEPASLGASALLESVEEYGIGEMIIEETFIVR